MDLDAEREKIAQEIQELERMLYPNSPSVRLDVSESSLSSDSEADSLPREDLVTTAAVPVLEEERWGVASNDEEDPKDKALPEDPETCLQLNMVYQEVILEKLAEISQLLAENQEQQEELLFDLAGAKCSKVKDGKSLPSNMYIGHFMKPYFKDKVTGVGPPANEDTREKAAQGIKAFEELLVTKWKHWEKALLRKSVVSDRLQRLLQPKLLKLEYLHQKQSRASSESERQTLEKQIREAEKEIQDINQLPEEALLGNRLDSHDWEKISNISFEGGRSAEEIRKFWQSSEHPSINKQEWSAEEVEQLKVIAATHGHLEWHLVAEELGTSRSAFQCLQKFQQYNKALKRKEWTEDEDRMLTQLVQEMRVGSHIPYRKIVYFMEGRDSMQLIYRWTKSLDPSLKKGFWAPEEDAKLLHAVAKYGAQDWFKIREEVPGRSDAQCRDRYIRRLHFSLKKGRWNAKEEEQLIELIEKYGVGHWARIASELPHRSGSQCLSKWKILVRKKRLLRRRRGRRRPPSRQWSSSSSSSGSDGDGSYRSSSGGGSEDSEAELEEPLESGRASPSPPYPVPDIDQWVPTRQSAGLPQRIGAACCPAYPAASPCLPDGSSATHCHPKAVSTTTSAPNEMIQTQVPCETPSTIPRGAQDLHLSDTHPASVEDPACKCVLKVPLETVLKVLRNRPTIQSHQRLKQPPLPNLPPGPGPGDSMAGPHLQRLWYRTFQNRQRRKRQALHRRLLKHRLLLAVIPWVGDITLPCPRAPRRPATVKTQADSIRMQLEHAHLASTPVFTLFIQLLQIDAAGCMEVVQERKTQLPTPLQPGTRGPQSQVPSSAENSTGCLLPSMPAEHTVKRANPRGRPRLGACRAESTSSQVPTAAAQGLRPKPKTVSELLCEKRLREARARKAAQALNSQLLISALILQPPLLPAPQAGPAASHTERSGPVAPVVINPSPSGSWQVAGTSVTDKQPSNLQTLPLTPAHRGAHVVAPAVFRSLAPAPKQVPINCPLSTLGQSQTPATSPKQHLPKVLPLFPTAPSPTQLPVQPLGLQPALGTQAAGHSLAASPSLPVSWLLTTQKLLPLPVATVVGLPQPVKTPDPTELPVRQPLSPPKTPACPGQPLSPPKTPACPGQPLSPNKTPACPGQPLSPNKMPACPGQPLSPPKTPAYPGQPLSPNKTPAYPGQPPASTDTEPREPQDLERPPPSEPEKKALDLGLLSQESEAAIRAWLRGCQGTCVPPLGTKLPYLPPALCSLRALSSLLLHKKALEHKASSLLGSDAAGAQAELEPGALQASLGLVRGQLQDNPAYLLLKTRFLAVFSLPALLATLPPSSVPTTLSSALGVSSESDSEDPVGDTELKDKQLDCMACSIQSSPVATDSIQGATGPGEDPTPSHLDVSDDLDVLKTRHARHARKRKRL